MGMDIDLAKALAIPMQREIRAEVMDWNLAQEKVMRGEADGLLGMSITEERRQRFDFAKSTFKREFGFLVRAGDNSIRNKGSLKGRKVGVTAGGFPKQFLEADSRIQLVLIEDYEDGFGRLINHQIDVLAADLWVATYLLEKRGIQGIKLTGKPFASVPAAIAVKKGNHELIDQINRGLTKLKAEGKIAEIEEQWRPKEMLFVSRERVRDLILTGAGVAVVIVFAAMAVWIFTLKRHIRLRQHTEASLQKSEERFQLAVRGSTDGLWDRNILTNEVFFADRYRELLGYSAKEFPGSFTSFEAHLHPEDKSRVLGLVAAHLERREPYDAEYRLRTKSGEYRWFRGRGQAIWDEQGRAIRMAGSITDITERKQAEERIHLLQMITMDVATAIDLPSALEVVLRRVCEKTGWVLGQAWVPEPDGRVLGCCPAWFAPGSDLGEFRTASKDITFLPGSGLPGRVWMSRQPVWVRDVTQDENFPRVEMAKKNGLKAGLGVPILAGDEVIAILEFFLKEPRSEDEHLVKVISAIAAQIGLAIERKRAEERLRWSEEQLRLLLDSTAEGIFGVDREGNCTFCNAASLRVLGYDRPADLLGKDMHRLIAHSYADGSPFPKAECSVVQSLVNARHVFAENDVFWRKNGSYFPAEYWSYPVFREGKHIGAVVTFLDITERKKAEKEARAFQEQLRALAGRLQAVREEERTSVAREIHDVLAQELTRLKIDLGWLRRRLSDPAQISTPALQEKVTSMLSVADTAIASVQKIATDLRPVVLDSLGLAAAIEWQAEEFQARTGITCDVTVPTEEFQLSHAAATGLFRIAQESLTNVARHAEASRVEVDLEIDDGQLLLRVRDNGVGIDPAAYKDPHTLGLLGMRERTLLLGGKIEISGALGKGTSVSVTMPINEKSLIIASS